MARTAEAEGALPAKLLIRLERLAERLADYLTEPRHPSLLHGDLWTGERARARRPGCRLRRSVSYCGHRSSSPLLPIRTFGPRSSNLRNAAAARCGPDLPGACTKLYPTLVHVRLFGGAYLPPIEQTLSRVGLCVQKKNRPGDPGRSPCETSRTPKALPIRWALARPPFFPKPLVSKIRFPQDLARFSLSYASGEKPPAPPWS